MFAYTENNRAIIVYPVPKEHLERAFGWLTDTEYEALIRKGVPDDAVTITKDDLPQDRYFRNAWIVSDEKIDIDMDKAREIHMEKIRIARDEALEVLDIETLKGIDVQAEKQVLRDIPQTFDLSKAQTPEELKALWPEELNG